MKATDAQNAIKLVRCPFCLVRAGEPCRTFSARTKPGPARTHFARIEYMRRWRNLSAGGFADDEGEP